MEVGFRCVLVLAQEPDYILDIGGEEYVLFQLELFRRRPGGKPIGVQGRKVRSAAQRGTENRNIATASLKLAYGEVRPKNVGVFWKVL
jgi:hypothetical protein